MKNLFVIFTGVLFTLTAAAQPINVLKLKNKSHFKERALFYTDSALYIICEVRYNKPHVIDEEFTMGITLVITDTAKCKKSAIFDLEKDSSFIRCTYNRHSVWQWDVLKSKITGQVKVISLAGSTIKLKLNIFINAHKEYIYKGKRKFKKAKDRLMQTALG